MLPKIWDKTAKVLAGVGALNWGLQEFLQMNVLSYVPEGTIKMVVVGAIGLSGGYLLYLAFKKQI